MTMSLAVEFGIDDTTYDFNVTREPFYGFKESNNHMLDNLNLSYGVEKVRKQTGNAGEVNGNYTHKGLPPPPIGQLLSKCHSKYSWKWQAVCWA